MHHGLEEAATLERLLHATYCPRITPAVPQTLQPAPQARRDAGSVAADWLAHNNRNVGTVVEDDLRLRSAAAASSSL